MCGYPSCWYSWHNNWLALEWPFARRLAKILALWWMISHTSSYISVRLLCPNVDSKACVYPEEYQSIQTLSPSWRCNQLGVEYQTPSFSLYFLPGLSYIFFIAHESGNSWCPGWKSRSHQMVFLWCVKQSFPKGVWSGHREIPPEMTFILSLWPATVTDLSSSSHFHGQ